MQVAISSQGKRLDALVEPWFGRAAYFLILDTDSMAFDTLENESAGELPEIDEINAARLLIGAGVQAVLTSNCGPEARQMLATAGVKVFQAAPGTVAETVEQFKDGRLPEVPAPGIRPPVEAGVGRDWDV